jgi:hypothetical protein
VHVQMRPLAAPAACFAMLSGTRRVHLNAALLLSPYRAYWRGSLTITACLTHVPLLISWRLPARSLTLTKFALSLLFLLQHHRLLCTLEGVTSRPGHQDPAASAGLPRCVAAALLPHGRARQRSTQGG